MTLLEDWEHRLEAVFDDIDDYLEDHYGDALPRHPVRPARGRTCDKNADGLFDVGAAYSLGIGSQHGEGYVLRIKFATLHDVPADLRAEVTDYVLTTLRERLPDAFPGRDLRVERDGELFKIVGNLDLKD